MSNRVYPPNSSGIKVIVVGLGYAGVAAAVECYGKGHQVIAFEQTAKVSEGGDMIGIAANAAHIMAAWGDGQVHKEFEKVTSVVDKLELFDWKGELLTVQSMPGFSEGTGYIGNRRELLEVMCNHAETLDIDIRRGKRITQYFETDTEAGVIVDGERIAADCVLCCDGVNSKGRIFVLGEEAVKPHPTGYATYRAWFHGDHLRDDPEAQWLVGQGRDLSIAFIGPDIHCIFGTGKKGKEVVWLCTHLDEYDITESWKFPGVLEDALKVVEGWDPRCRAIISKTPRDQLIHHKLLWRDPLPRWVSDKGKVMLIGDSAHTFLPNSIAGAGTAIEDSGTVAVCLELAGKKDVPTALRVCEKMRYDRVCTCQKMGIETREVWHRTDWSKFKKNKEYVQLPQPEWIFGHDPQMYAYEEFETAAHAVRTGSPYQPRNVPPPGSDTRTHDFDASKKWLAKKDPATFSTHMTAP